MGQIAEDMIDGTCCDLCGCYFQDPEKYDYLYTHGHPATCWSCWDGLDEDEMEIRQRSTVQTVNDFIENKINNQQ